MWSFAAKSTCGLIAALVLTSSSLAQVAPPGGGGPGGNVSYANGFKMTVTHIGTGKFNLLSLLGSTSETVAFSQASAGVTGVVGTISAECSGKTTVLIEWVGTGTPPPYAFVQLNSSASWNGATSGGSAGNIQLGLPLVQNPPLQGPALGTTQTGRKIAKLKLDQNGTATYEIEGGLTVTAASPTAQGLQAGAVGEWGAGANLQLKALGLSYDSNTRMEDVTPTGPSVYPWPAGGDDFERQRAEFAVSLTHTWVNANPYPIGPPLPVLELSGAMYSVWVPVGYLGSWSAPQLSSGVSTGSRTEKFDLGGNLSNIEIANDYSLEDLAAMRLSPKEVTVTINGSDPQSTIQGPFQGELKASVWAPERVIATGEDTVTDVSVREINGCDSVTVAAGQDETLEVNSVTTTEWSAEVSVVGGLSGEIDKVGVKADCGFKLGYKHSVALGGKHSKHVQPTVRTKYWYEVTTTVTNMNRALASYGDRGYIADYSNRILYSKKPTRNGEFKWEELP